MAVLVIENGGTNEFPFLCSSGKPEESQTSNSVSSDLCTLGTPDSPVLSKICNWEEQRFVVINKPAHKPKDFCFKKKGVQTRLSISRALNLGAFSIS